MHEVGRRGFFLEHTKSGGSYSLYKYGYEVLVKLYLLEQIDKRIKL